MDGDSTFLWTSAARSDVGPVRSRNEDACLAQPQRGLWAVADGMGGHAFGDLASGAVVTALERLALSADPSAGLLADLPDAISAARDSLAAVNVALRAEARARGVPVIGSTVALLIARGADAACLWAGDSRIYLLRGGRLQQLTRDHSQREDLKARGADPAGASANTITRAVGAADALVLDALPLRLRDGDLFLLCSDGLSTPVAEQDIAAALAAADCAQAAERLVELALAGGGRDNVTVVVARVDDVGGDKTVINPAL